MRDQIADMCLSYFLCEYDPRSPRKKTVDVVRQIALSSYAREKVDEFVDLDLDAFQQRLVEEFNDRYVLGRPLRFQISDSAGVGSIVEGYRPAKRAKEIAFQNALRAVTPGEFEKLAAIILRVLGCQDVFFTPSSHDQGVDAFGNQMLIEPTPYGTTHRLTWIAQAKHFQSTRVTTGNVRELVGSKEFLIAKVFSTVDVRYKELRLRPYAPTAVVLITTEEIPITVRRLADGAGVYIFASSDLYHLLSARLKRNSIASIRALIKAESKTIVTLF